MIKRELYMEKIRPFIGNELIKVLTGIRRSGKSVMLELIKEELISQGIAKEQFISVNFENMNNAELCKPQNLHNEIKKRASSIHGKVYLFFDEIQEVDDWEKCINSFRVEFGCDIYITGSNAKLLSGELATYIAGRYVAFVIYPFSFSEFIRTYDNSASGITKEEAFKRYLTLGGMPFLSNLKSNQEAGMQYLRDVYNSVILKDVVMRNAIRDVDLLGRLIFYLLSNVGHTFSASSITKYFKSERRAVSHDTILNYINACEEAFLFYRVSRQDLIGKKVLSVNEKYYLADHGLREAVCGKNTTAIDQVLENIVCMELLRRGYSVTVGIAGTKEIDFICEKDGEKVYIQVSYLLASDDTIEREFSAYASVKDNFPKYVVSLDEFDMSRNGIKHVNIRDFLLMEKWN